MLQRVQSLYLFLSFVLYLILFFSPLFYVLDHAAAYSVHLYKLNPALNGNTQSLFPLAAAVVLAAISILAAIFVFKNRKLQVKVIWFSFILILISAVLLGVYHYIYTHASTEVTAKLSLWVAVPLIAGIFNFLAIRSINKDQALVDSLNRLR
jgi:hypothetical protein